MGTSRSFGEMASKVSRAGDRIPNAARTGTVAAVRLVKTAVREELQAAGVNGRLSGVGKSGARVGVSDAGIQSGVNPTAIVRMYGPAHLVERDTKPHGIQPKKRGKKRGVVINGQVRARVNHPGTKGKHPWAKAVRRVRPLVPQVYAAAVRDEFRKVFH